MSQVLFAGVPVDGFASALEWYTQLFGRGPDVVAHETEVMWRVADGGWLYVVHDPDRAGGALVSIAVDNLDSALGDLERRGLSAGPVERIGEAGRKATLHDPDGNAVSLLEVLPNGNGNSDADDDAQADANG